MYKLLAFGRAIIKHVVNGMAHVSREDYDERITICETCELCNKNDDFWMCNSCGCQIKPSTIIPGKAMWASEECPEGKWQKLSLPVIEKKKGCGGCGKR